jgi:hypothetical protein
MSRKAEMEYVVRCSYCIKKQLCGFCPVGTGSNEEETNTGEKVEQDRGK